MMKFTVWVKVEKTSIFIGGDPSKGQAPVITGELKNPQILVDMEKGTITIVETK